MKKSLIFSCVLIVIDQVIKLLIAHYCIDVNVILLPDILSFRPIQNINLNWIASMIDYETPVLMMIIIQVFALTIILLYSRYLSYLWIGGKNLITGMLIFFIAGIMCSFIDVIFWGGSLDFLRLFDWFIFDLKDTYLDIGLAFLILFTIEYYIKSYRRMSKAERKQTGVWIWIKKGMPSVPVEEEL